MVLRDQRMILNYVETGLFVPMESTSLCAGEAKSYGEAVRETRDQGWWTHKLDRVEGLIDVAAARRAVRPLPAVTVEDGVRVVEVERLTAPAEPVARAGAAPALPIARGGERPQRRYPARVERWRSSLLDLSFRNPLLNMRPGKTSLDLHVPHGALGALEDMLFGGSSISVLPHDRIADIHRERGARTAQDIDAEALRGLLVGERVVFGACTEASYLARLRGIQRRARTVAEETGANNLFLTLGTLEWEDGGRQARAPLFLLPVTLRGQRNRPFVLEIDEGGYAQPNQCLLEKLHVSHGLSIPEFRTSRPTTRASTSPGRSTRFEWRSSTLGCPSPWRNARTLRCCGSRPCSCGRTCPRAGRLLRNPVVRHLIETPTDSFVDQAADEPVSANAEADAYCPISIDGSQLQAVSWAEAGRSFVLEGPPGTGKAQTITNLIANALAVGKTVLFVAEKQAALDVVRRRLDSVGLRELCLDLHGKDAGEHAQAAARGAARAHRVAMRRPGPRARHQSAVDHLARFPAALHELGPAGLSAWTARQSLLTAGDGPEVEIPTEVVSRTLDTDALYRSAHALTHALYDLWHTRRRAPVALGADHRA